MAARRPWWATWPGAFGLGALSLAMVLVGVAAAVVYVTLPVVDASGPEAATVGPPAWRRVLQASLAGLALVLPVLTGAWARRMWLGYVLLGLGMSAGAMVWGLFQFGVL